MSIYGPGGYGGNSSRGSAFKGRLLIVAVLVVMSVLGYAMKRSNNPITGQAQYVQYSPREEITLGLQAAPEMARQFGGLHPDQRAQDTVDRVGQRLLAAVPKIEGIQEDPRKVYQFDFHLLADTRTVNAFALPGGQIFITAALFSRLDSEGQLAGVLGHEIGHVVYRHSAQRAAQAGLFQGVAGAVATGAADGSAGGQMVGRGAMMAAQMLQLKYGRGDETECDEFAVQIMPAAGYDPRAMIGVMKVLREASGGAGQPEWMSSHPDPGNRLEHLDALIRRRFPQGVPQGLEP